MVGSEEALSKDEDHSRLSAFETKSANVASDVGELSPKSVSAAEALSRFKNSTLRFVENEEANEEDDEDMDRSETSK